ncbi:MAG: hypothetical protein H7240_00260 [Glaciimonas sp.]|nr:hypothetical protein [Glaciimonas sp.]
MDGKRLTDMVAFTFYDNNILLVFGADKTFLVFINSEAGLARSDIQAWILRYLSVYDHMAFNKYKKAFSFI